MTKDEMKQLVNECGLDWQRGFVPLFDGDSTNRYAVLIEAAIKAAVEAEREACAVAAEHPFYNVLGNTALAYSIRARGGEE